MPASFKFDRGFTGHEHLDDFNLINMNGRMYDQILAMFLSPDPFIQSPGETQNFNRYAYVMNNPLKYTDPTGYSYDPIDDEWTDVYWYDPYPYDVPARERSYRYTMTWEGVKFWGTKAAWNAAHGILPGGPTGMDYDAWHKSAAVDKGISFIDWYNQGGRYGSEGFFMHLPSICLGYNGSKGKGFHCGEAGVVWSRPRWIYIPTNMSHASSGGDYLQYEANLVNATRTQGNLVWYNSSGDVAGKYPAVSGSGNPMYYTIPAGRWEAGYLNTEYSARFIRHNISFRITLGPDRYDSLRGRETSLMRIHPIMVGSLGTEGCIGLIGDSLNISHFYNRYTDYYNTYGGMPVFVIYPK